MSSVLVSREHHSKAVLKTEDFDYFLFQQEQQRPMHVQKLLAYASHSTAQAPHRSSLRAMCLSLVYMHDQLITSQVASSSLSHGHNPYQHLHVHKKSGGQPPCSFSPSLAQRAFVMPCACMCMCMSIINLCKKHVKHTTKPCLV